MELINSLHRAQNESNYYLDHRTLFLKRRYLRERGVAAGSLPRSPKSASQNSPLNPTSQKVGKPQISSSADGKIFVRSLGPSIINGFDDGRMRCECRQAARGRRKRLAGIAPAIENRRIDCGRQ
jgi:hypothetical protein